MLEHDDPPFESAKGPRGARRRQCRGAGGDAEIEQQASVRLRCRSKCRQDGGVAGNLAPEHVLTRRQARERMEEEETFRCGRDDAEPEIAALDVRELVTERHALLVVAHRREPRRNHDHRVTNAGGER